MNRFSFREFALLCAPIGLLGLIFVGPRLLHPPKDPEAVILLSVREIPTTFGINPQNPRLHFGWQADATGGPQYYHQIGFREQIVAVTKSGEKIVYSDPPVAGSANALSSGGGGVTPGKSSVMSRNLQIDSADVPLTATRFEWRGDLVAVPRASGSIDQAVSAATLAKWAKIKGAARVQTTIRLRYNTAKNAILRCELEPVNAENASKGADTCISVDSRVGNRRIYRRLVAFDGRTTRLVWHKGSDYRNPYWQSNSKSGSMSREVDALLFRLRDVPASWGEIVYLFDVVYLDSAPGESEEAADLATIKRLEKAGGVRFSRRLVVRRRGQTVAAPGYQKTPNLQFSGIQTLKSARQTRILVKVRYTGKLARPEIDSTWGAVFYDEKGRPTHDLHPSYRVRSGANPGEYLCDVTLQTGKLKSQRVLQMRLEIGDQEAAPLVIQQKIALP